MHEGGELMLWCEGGPSTLRRVSFPPPVEIVERDGVYVLNDETDDPTNWRYVFVVAGKI